MATNELATGTHMEHEISIISHKAEQSGERRVKGRECKIKQTTCRGRQPRRQQTTAEFLHLQEASSSTFLSCRRVDRRPSTLLTGHQLKLGLWSRFCG